MPTLDFKGKQHIYAHHLTVPYRPLVPAAGKSCNPAAEDDNLIIHGDNLHALKALLPRYAGRVKCIYIDPPYNTGNEGWIYNDKVNSPLMKAWLKENAPVDNEDLERHDKWLCMMWPACTCSKNCWQRTASSSYQSTTTSSTTCGCSWTRFSERTHF